MDSILHIHKILLHTHLEGSLTKDTLLHLSSRNNIELPFNLTSDIIKTLIIKNDWTSFRKIYYSICSCFKTEDDYYLALFNYGLKLKAENIYYAEIHLSPWRHLSRNIQLDVIYKGLARAITELQKEHKIKLRLIYDIVRNSDEKIEDIIAWILSNNNTYVIGLGISGGTDAMPRYRYREYCKRIKSNGLGITIHAGELEPSGSILESICLLQADRIVHGITLVEDPQLFQVIEPLNVHFELCPTANEIIGLGKPRYESIRQMITLVKNYSINTDDELLFGTSLSREYHLLRTNSILDHNEFIKSQRNAINASFLSPSDKNDLHIKLTESLNHLSAVTRNKND